MPVEGLDSGGFALDEVAKTTSVRIDPDRHVVTQRGAITAALGLCPRECHRLHIGRCSVCQLLEAAERAIR
jgi:hypothetical protein